MWIVASELSASEDAFVTKYVSSKVLQTSVPRCDSHSMMQVNLLCCCVHHQAALCTWWSASRHAAQN